VCGVREVMKLSLPYPPSANRYLRHTARGTYRTKEANLYRDSVAYAAFLAGARMTHGSSRLIATLHPKMTKAGKSSGTCLDLDNCIKVLCDALQGICYANDKQLRHISMTVGDPIVGGGLTVEIEAA
jgi:crossover junction endodeoxyribonuclease RusA